MAVQFDSKHRPMQEMHPGDKAYLKLAKPLEEGYHLPNATSIDIIRTGPYEIKRRVGKLAYELKLPPEVRIHPVISIIYLKPVSEDLYQRGKSTPPAPIEVDGEQRYLIDRIIRKEVRRQPGDRTRKVYYKVRWQGYGPKDDNWIEEQDLRSQVPELVEAFDKHLTRLR